MLDDVHNDDVIRSVLTSNLGFEIIQQACE